MHVIFYWISSTFDYQIIALITSIYHGQLFFFYIGDSSSNIWRDQYQHPHLTGRQLTGLLGDLEYTCELIL